MMRFLHNLAKPFTSTTQPQINFPKHLKPTRINLSLKSYLKSNPIKTILLFSDLLRKKISAVDSYSLLYVVKACAKKSLATEGKQAHALVIKLGYKPIIFIQTSLMDMYAATTNVSAVHKLFDEIPNKNVVCWTSLISAYVQNQKSYRALEIFRQMQSDNNVEPDQIAFTVALSACADLGALDKGVSIHDLISRKPEFSEDLSLMNALLNMYVKCGDIRKAMLVFDNIRIKDVRTWTSMIVGHALHGQAEEALRLFSALEEENNPRSRKGRGTEDQLLIPNEVMFIGVLMACSHAGMVEEGKRYFRSMIEVYGIKPTLSHFGCMVDLLCRRGLLKEAYSFILAMPIQPNAVIWRTLLGASGVHGNKELAAAARSKLYELNASLVGDDVALSNIYAAKGMWEEKIMLRNEMTQRRTPGCSSVEVGKLHS
ncbi:putative lipoate-protein ligase A [Capsicum annuum]|uniref:putative pentatricopeptide repeat-containing protein At1g74400 n=1 Tax=Capsicum annuum TaxID=4072 RepID=UPI0007BFD2BB|nr:putative pentatricopeptide repeat-containing protein At1g74400 [Capsicum annuum]KAF3682755.1 putative lipoate-protein ligase A [Capsicum annuum]